MESIFNFTSAIIVAIISVVVALIQTSVGQKLIADRLAKSNKKSMQNAVNNYSKLNEACQAFAQLPGVKKAVIVETKNNGGIPRPGCIIYSSINFPTEWRNTWQNQPLDNEYADLVAKLLREGEIEFGMDSLKSDELLKGLFSAQGIDFCHCIALKQYHDKFFFLAIDFYDKALVYDNEYVKNIIRIKIAEIKTLMSND